MLRLGLGLLIACAAGQAAAGSFDVNPIRLDFDRDSRSGSINVNNDDTVPLSFQVRLFGWTQDADGNDRYAESSDLVWFPRIMTVPPGEKRLIRVGTQAPPGDRERSYRLFIEELPPPATTPGQGAQIAVRVRFGVPLFVAAAAPRASAVIEDLQLSGGELQVRVANTGNQHVKLETLHAQGGERRLAEMAGGYLLPGVRRSWRLPVEGQACERTGALELRIDTDAGLVLQRTLDVTPARCRP